MKFLLILLSVSCALARPKWGEWEEENDLTDNIPGRPGVDYPILSSVPHSEFTCNGRVPGYYGDTETGCQVFHVCHYKSRQDSFLCPNGSVFDQTTFACEWWFNVNCPESPRYYDLNQNLFKGSDVSLYGKISPALLDFMLDSIGIELPGNQKQLNAAPITSGGEIPSSTGSQPWSSDREESDRSRGSEESRHNSQSSRPSNSAPISPEQQPWPEQTSGFYESPDIFNSGPFFSGTDFETETITVEPEIFTVGSFENPDAGRAQETSESFEPNTDNLVTIPEDNIGAVENNVEPPPQPPSRRQVAAQLWQVAPQVRQPQRPPRKQQAAAAPPRSPNPAAFSNLVNTRQTGPNKRQQTGPAVFINQPPRQALRASKVAVAPASRNAPPQQTARPATRPRSAPVQVAKTANRAVSAEVQATKPATKAVSSPVQTAHRPPPRPAATAKAPRGVISLGKFAQSRASPFYGFSESALQNGGWKPIGSVAKRALRPEDYN